MIFLSVLQKLENGKTTRALTVRTSANGEISNNPNELSV